MPEFGKALLFDIDGTLADTDALHLEAFNQVFAPHGHVFDRARASKELMGFSNSSISERFLPGQSPAGREPPLAEVAPQPEEAFADRQAVVAEQARLRPPLLPLDEVASEVGPADLAAPPPER